jgi:hypothetical protein
MPGPTLDSILAPGRAWREAVLAAAVSQLQARDHRVEDYWRSALGVEWHGKFPPHWCGAFNLWALHEAGLALDKQWHIAGCWPRHDSVGYGFILTQPHQLMVTKTPQPGDTSYKGAPYQHHAIVESLESADRPAKDAQGRPCVVSDVIVHTIDGNQGPPLFIKRSQHWLSDPAYTHFSISPLIDAAIAAAK